MKKQYIAIAASLTLIAHSAQAATKTQQEILRSLVSLHNLAFGKDNLFKAAIPASELTQWNGAVNDAKKFVEENSKNQLGMKDGDLTKPLSAIEKANIELQNALKITRGLINSPSNLKQQIAIFDKIKADMIKAQSDLNRATFILNKEQKTAAKDILTSMAMFLEITAAKAIKDTAQL